MARNGDPCASPGMPEWLPAATGSWGTASPRSLGTSHPADILTLNLQPPGLNGTRFWGMCTQIPGVVRRVAVTTSHGFLILPEGHRAGRRVISRHSVQPHEAHADVGHGARGRAGTGKRKMGSQRL